MRIVYFAWVRERVGKADEQVDPPAGVSTVADLVRWLKAQAKNTPTPSRTRRSCGRPSTTPM